ncbi:uncharacterized protein LOC117175598 [Belonocnema kinseyi]|uniref:uncharacterized protein LOC117175598 n=1 Tax=Belonocnema kinseyi TaxID=2817044 RepID=UPI00143DBCDD|nr:uncharacterized protein LOC117175598 [Belonocnema kinseyi]
MFAQTEHTNSFTQTEQNNSSYSGQRQTQRAAMFDPQQIQQQQTAQGQQSQQQQQSQQMYVTEKKEDKSQQQSTTAEFPFYYNVNMLQKVQSNAVSTIGQITTDDKGCYRFDVQPVGYNTLLNQMSIAAATNSTFKCDICGLVFGHMSLLNHHKRIHNTTPNNLQQHPQQVVLQTPTTVTVSTTPERPHTCDICGACFILPGELKSHKTNTHQKPKVQICEDCGSEDACEHHPTKVKKTIKPGHHPVKRRGVTSVTKCHKCNGTGIIFIGGKQNNQNQPEKPFHCNVCDGTFSRYSSLWSHKRLHSGDKPFKCEVCGLAFAKENFRSCMLVLRQIWEFFYQMSKLSCFCIETLYNAMFVTVIGIDVCDNRHVYVSACLTMATGTQPKKIRNKYSAQDICKITVQLPLQDISSSKLSGEWKLLQAEELPGFKSEERIDHYWALNKKVKDLEAHLKELKKQKGLTKKSSDILIDKAKTLLDEALKKNDLQAAHVARGMIAAAENTRPAERTKEEEISKLGSEIEPKKTKVFSRLLRGKNEFKQHEEEGSTTCLASQAQEKQLKSKRWRGHQFVYVDDALFGASGIDSARETCQQLSDLLASADFHLRKWASNYGELLEGALEHVHNLRMKNCGIGPHCDYEAHSIPSTKYTGSWVLLIHGAIYKQFVSITGQVVQTLPRRPRKHHCQHAMFDLNSKALLTVFFDYHGAVHQELLPQDRAVNKECDICEIGFSDRFALKRHRAIHEKYGQTARNQNANSSSNTQQGNANNQQQPQQTQQGQQVVVVNATTPVTVSQGQAVLLDDVYKCQVAFPEPK